MKKILAIIVMAVFLGVGSLAISADDKPLPDRNKVICYSDTCICGKLAVKCMCSTAIRLLKDFDEGE